MLSLLLLPLLAAATDPKVGAEKAPVFDQTFWKTWADGQAELAGYDLTIPRYNQSRKGVAVTIYVTETFSNSLRVKADPGKHPDSDQFPVMKLNLVKDYQTGIYDYNEMASTFVSLGPVNGRAAGAPVKISFSRQEWCGNTYHQVLFDGKSIRATRHSYFDGDGDSQATLAEPADALAEDALLLWARGMAQPALGPGESRSVPVLVGLASMRGIQSNVSWVSAVLSRGSATERITVPAGAFTAEVYRVKFPDGSTRAIRVEQAAPHRVIQWESSTGEHAELLRSDRLKYWQMNGEGMESALVKLGLKRRPPRTP